MQQPGDILLVSCYELGHQPLSLAWPLAALEAAGFRPRAIDTSVEPLDEAAVRAASLVAISVPMHTALRLGVEVAHTVRQINPSAHVNFYGLYAWLNADYLSSEGLADSVIGGEAEQSLVEVAQSHANGVRRAVGHHGWIAPRREALPALAKYAHFLRDGRAVPAGYVEATRGCKHTCTHCPITPVYQGRFLAVPRDIVLDDARSQIQAGAQHITFGDPDFLNGPSHSLRIVRQLHQEFPEVTFDATIKIEHILRHAELMPELRGLGCAFVVSAVESLSDEVLARLEKGHTAADVDRALDVMRAAGIPLRPSLVAFTPWTTLDDYVHLLHFAHSRGMVDAIDPVQFAIRLLIPPGSALLNDCGGASWLGELDPAAFSYRWRHPDPRMDALYAEVSAIVERGEVEQRDVWDTFAAIRAAAYQLAGQAVDEPKTPLERHPAPRLTESWFC